MAKSADQSAGEKDQSARADWLKLFQSEFKSWGWKMGLIWGVALILWCWNWTHPGPRFLGRDTVNSVYGWEWVVPNYHSDDDQEETSPPHGDE